MRHFIEGKLIACDTETTGLNAWKGDRPFAFSFCNEDGETAYFEVQVDPHTREPEYGGDVIYKLRNFFWDKSITKIFHNGFFDVRMFEAIDITVCGPGGPVKDGGRMHETMFSSHCCNTLEPSFGLKELSDKYLDIGREDKDRLRECVKRLRKVAGKLGWKIGYEKVLQPDGTHKQESMIGADYWLPYTLGEMKPALVAKQDRRLCREYAIQDAVRTMGLHLFNRARMKELEVRDTYKREMELWPVTYRMGSRGVRLDPLQTKKQMKEHVEKSNRYKKEISKYTWKGFNLNSPAQVSKLLFKKLKLKPTLFTPSGQKSTSGDALDPLRAAHPAVNSIVKYKAAVKGFEFFARYKYLMVPDPLNQGGMCLHPSFRQMGPATGRYSCADPNLQNVANFQNTQGIEPIRARGPFGPRPGYRWLFADYKGQEMRMFASVSHDPDMLAAYRDGREIHDETCERIWGGRNNPIAIAAAMRALELDGTGEQEVEGVKEFWKKHHIRRLKDLSQKNREDLADQWLAGFEYKQVKAQASLGKKTAKQLAKMMNFSIIYGGGPKAAASLMDVPVSEAKFFLTEYDRHFPHVKIYMRELMRQARIDGFIRTLWGRRLAIDAQLAYRAVNYMVQGSCADHMKQSLVRCDRWLRENGINGYVVMTIHDEIVFEIAVEEFTLSLMKNLRRIMCDTDNRTIIPMEVDMLMTDTSWAEKKKIRRMAA